MAVVQPPTDEQAMQFATMLRAGLPASQAIFYFFSEPPNAALLPTIIQTWLSSRPVLVAQAQILSKLYPRSDGKLVKWEELALEQQMECALKMHYAQLATLLYTNNYIEANAQEKTKLDTARTALEAKVAGTAGQGNPIENFFADWKAGRLQGVAPLAMPASKPS